jgi:hypothetical protein
MSRARLGWVPERSIGHAWKACVPQGTEGSNPSPSASGSKRISYGESVAKSFSVLRECEFIIFGDKDAFAELKTITKLGVLMVAKLHFAFDLQFIRRFPIS